MDILNYPEKDTVKSTSIIHSVLKCIFTLLIAQVLMTDNNWPSSLVSCSVLITAVIATWTVQSFGANPKTLDQLLLLDNERIKLAIAMATQLYFGNEMVRSFGTIRTCVLSTILMLESTRIQQIFTSSSWPSVGKKQALEILAGLICFVNELKDASRLFGLVLLAIVAFADAYYRHVLKTSGSSSSLRPFSSSKVMAFALSLCFMLPVVFYDLATKDINLHAPWSYTGLLLFLAGVLYAKTVSNTKRIINLNVVGVDLLIPLCANFLLSPVELCVSNVAATMVVFVAAFIQGGSFHEYSPGSLGEEYGSNGSDGAVDRIKRVFIFLMSQKDSRRIMLFLGFNVSFMFVELVVGLWTNSLGLISDAGHMFVDNGALVIGLAASYISKWQPDNTHSYGYGRYEVLSGFVNALLLVFIGLSVGFEAVERFFDPPAVHTNHLLLTAVAGLVINIIGLVNFHDFSHGGCGGHGHSHGGHGHSHGGHGHSHGGVASGAGNENMYGVYLHVLADTLGSIGVIISSVLIEWKQWYITDPLCSIFISVLILGSTVPLLKQTGLELVQRVPPSIEGKLQAYLSDIERRPEIIAVEKSNFWQMTPKEAIGSLQLLVVGEVNEQELLREFLSTFKNNFGIENMTIQLLKGDVGISSKANGSAVTKHYQQHHHSHSDHHPHHHHGTATNGGPTSLHESRCSGHHSHGPWC